ncbi:GD21101 [Drosophila simulans]|uniref:GD21101 n=1 Tax=Drosophila simulans TaxID=7240 RepID=B4QT67_DROSI|nr:GD21101 [Drosophila simulans]
MAGESTSACYDVSNSSASFISQGHEQGVAAVNLAQSHTNCWQYCKYLQREFATHAGVTRSGNNGNNFSNIYQDSGAGQSAAVTAQLDGGDTMGYGYGLCWKCISLMAR